MLVSLGSEKLPLLLLACRQRHQPIAHKLYYDLLAVGLCEGNYRTRPFVKFVLEPDVVGEARLGYEEHWQAEMFEPHFGIDESGKGDYFGPLVVAGVYTNSEITRALLNAGIMDSKRIGSGKRIRELANIIRAEVGSEMWQEVNLQGRRQQASLPGGRTAPPLLEILK